MLCIETLTVSAIRFTVDRLIIRGLGGCGSCLVSGWLGLLSTWLSKVAPGQESTLGPLVGSSDSRTGVWIGVAPVKLLGGLHHGHFVGPLVHRTSPGTQL